MVKFIPEDYNNLVKDSNEKRLLVNKIKEITIKRKKGTCLEIGLGTTAFFSKKLSDYFSEYTIIEKEKFTGQIPKNVTIINSTWGKKRLKKKFDVIIASHVVYYFKDKFKEVEKMINHLKKGGKLILVVNGDLNNYGSLKKDFFRSINTDYKFTYSVMKDILKNKKFKEHTIKSTITFKNPEGLYDALKISFDTHPKQYLKNKEWFIDYFKKNIKNNKFVIEQKIFEVCN